jgi:hypothetical protein
MNHQSSNFEMKNHHGLASSPMTFKMGYHVSLVDVAYVATSNAMSISLNWVHHL